MGTEIIPVRLGFDTCYVLRDKGVIAVDAGAPNKAKKFLSALNRASIQPEEVRLIVMTHGHWDHIGSARDIQSATGAELVLHEREIRWLEESQTPLSPGVTPWGRIFSKFHHLFMPLIKVPPASVNISLGNEGMELTDYGIPGRILYTPGHSSGSVSILLDSGEVFVGDLAMNKFPLRLSPGLPIFADDKDAIITSWKKLIEAGATRVYPAHGKPFSIEVIQRKIAG